MNLLKVVITFWEETQNSLNHTHVMITFRRRFNMLVDKKTLGIEMRNWVGRWLEI